MITTINEWRKYNESSTDVEQIRIYENNELKSEYNWSPEYCYSVKIYYDNGEKDNISWYNINQIHKIKKIAKDNNDEISVFKSEDGKYLEEVNI